MSTVQVCICPVQWWGNGKGYSWKVHRTSSCVEVCPWCQTLPSTSRNPERYRTSYGWHVV